MAHNAASSSPGAGSSSHDPPCAACQATEECAVWAHQLTGKLASELQPNKLYFICSVRPASTDAALPAHQVDILHAFPVWYVRMDHAWDGRCVMTVQQADGLEFTFEEEDTPGLVGSKVRRMVTGARGRVYLHVLLPRASA